MAEKLNKGFKNIVIKGLFRPWECPTLVALALVKKPREPEIFMNKTRTNADFSAFPLMKEHRWLASGSHT